MNIEQIQKKALNTREVAAMYGLSYGTLCNWRSGQKFGPAFHRLGKGRGRIVYFMDDLEAWTSRNIVQTLDSARA